MWKITDLDYDAALFTNAEARVGADVGPTLWAKWLHRDFFTPSRTVTGGRGGQYAARKIFEIRVMNVVTQETAIPPSEAKELAALAAKGTWGFHELAKEPVTNWRSYVLREGRPPVDVHLIFSKTENCWGYDLLGAGNIKNSASVVLAAARELITVSKYCWNILHGAGRAATARDE